MCGSSNLQEIIDLGSQPLANAFVEEHIRSEPEDIYPLKVSFCGDCTLSQLTNVVDPVTLYEDYIYFSSGVATLSEHFNKYAETVTSRFLDPGDLVVEIASNDGVLLNWFADRDYRVLGIEPALNIAEVSRSLGIETLTEFFSSSLARNIAEENGKAKAIISNNVVAHINDHQDLATGVKSLLHDNGVWVLELPHMLDMFENLSYDTIYHEHLSYFSIRPMQRWLKANGLEVFDAEITKIHGQSLRAFIGHEGAHEVTERVEEILVRENNLGMDRIENYRALSDRISKSAEAVSKLVKELKQTGKTIAAYGAPAKGNTLLNYCNINDDYLDYAVDDLSQKQGKYTPGTRLRCISREEAQKQLPDYFVMLAWNYEQPIIKKEAAFLENGGHFIIPIGDEIRII
jgi:2-polyprenyl-3-methyl-5-hydroxy-6-metoxy-1,4-benzoquinol methylase